MIVIARYSFPHEAHMAKASLESVGIESHILNEHLVNMQWLYSNAIGGVRLVVAEKDVLEIAARIMHALYRPGHALITLSLTDLTSDPMKRPWGLNSIDLQPDLSVFYTNVNRPRDVIPAVLDILWSTDN